MCNFILDVITIVRGNRRILISPNARHDIMSILSVGLKSVLVSCTRAYFKSYATSHKICGAEVILSVARKITKCTSINCRVNWSIFRAWYHSSLFGRKASERPSDIAVTVCVRKKKTVIYVPIDGRVFSLFEHHHWPCVTRACDHFICPGIFLSFSGSFALLSFYHDRAIKLKRSLGVINIEQSLCSYAVVRRKLISTRWFLWEFIYLLLFFYFLFYANVNTNDL